jgi:signal peptidase II
MTDAARAWARAGLVAAAVLALDQATKAVVRHGLALGDEDAVLPAVKLVHTRNSGVAFGTFAGSTLVSVLVVVALAALLGYFATHATKPLVWLPTGMLVGGAVGNIVDRVRDGAVTDFVKLPAWPAFNLADASITLGVVVLLVVVERSDRAADRDG